MSVAQLLNLWTIPWAVQMHSKEMCREAKIHTCLPFTLVYSGPQPWWYSALRSQSCRSASADVWAKGKERDFNESSANQSSMAEALHRFQHDGICASLLCNVSTYPVTQSPQKNSVLGVRGSSLPLLWTFSASTSLCDQDGFYDLFAPFAKAVLMQSLHLSQLGSVGTSVLSFFPSHSIALHFHWKHTFLSAPRQPPTVSLTSPSLGTPVAQAEPAGYPAHCDSTLTHLPQLSFPEPLVASPEAHTLLRVMCYLTKEYKFW